MAMNYQDLRREYQRGGLRRRDLAACPIVQFEHWFEQLLASPMPDPTAMVLATLEPDGVLRQRVVLLKEISDGGFVFYTNHGSDKARALASYPRVSLHFPWTPLERQVQVSGRARRLSQSVAAEYFAGRPRESQLAAWASHQSQSVASRAALEAAYVAMADRFADDEVPLPEHWGGYSVEPDTVEFWQGGARRLHDRFRYSRNSDGGWSIERLQP
jgi:pyridoxamine 5'-phosphate oxidase